jgi:hypothetical protein
MTFMFPLRQTLRMCCRSLFKASLYRSELIVIPYSKKSTSKIPSLSQNTDAMIFSCKKTLNKLRQGNRRFRPNRNIKNVLLCHDNGQPHTSLRTREAIAKMGWSPSPTCSQPRSGIFRLLPVWLCKECTT